MTRDYRAIVNTLKAELGLTQAALAELLGTSQASVSRWQKGTHPDPKPAAIIDRVWAEYHPDDAATSVDQHVKVVGLIGAGAEIMPEFEQVGPDGLYEISVSIPVPSEAFAFEVQGDSMYPRYDSGDVVVCGRQRTTIDDVVGTEAAVLTQDGRRFLKKIRRGAHKGLFDLESHNASPIRDVALVWAAEIDLIIPSRKWKKLGPADKTKLVARTMKGKER